MKKIALLFVLMGAVVVSCVKSAKIPLSYTVESVDDSVVHDIYIPATGTYIMPINVKFLTGNTTDSVTLRITGLPSDITVTPSVSKGLPTYIENFVFSTHGARMASYPVSIVASAPGERSQTYNFTLTVIPADCATTLLGSLNGSNACSTRNYKYVATASATDTANTMNIANFGGYGPDAVAYVVLDCAHDSVHIPSQRIGNGATLQGSGTFTATTMTINYSASTTPGGFPETCTVTLSK